jgi:uncharacterized repeat protein (TIGR01451 family)
MTTPRRKKARDCFSVPIFRSLIAVLPVALLVVSVRSGSPALAASLRGPGPVAAGGHLVAPADSAISASQCGQWSVDTTADPQPVSVLLRFATVSSTDAWTVGWSSGADRPISTLTEHWNGFGWDLVPSPNPGRDINLLTGVSAVSSNDVWAVGYQFDDGVSRSLGMHWDGTDWQTVPTVDPGRRYDDLESVTATGTDDVWAAGRQSDDGGFFSPLFEHWDGTEWKSGGTGPRIDHSAYIQAITALTPSNVWAVGYQGDGSPFGTLIMHRSNRGWKIVPSPNVGIDNHLQGIAALSPTNIWAVGYEYDGTNYHSLAIHWDGSEWSVVPTPDSTEGQDYLRGVWARSPSDVWASGYSQDPNGNLFTLIEHWDGVDWTLMPAANPDPSNVLISVGGVRGRVWAAGFRSTGSDQRTLVESLHMCAGEAAGSSRSDTTRRSGARALQAGRFSRARVPTSPAQLLEPTADLKATIFDTDPAPFGEPILYGLSVRNKGPDGAVNVRLEDPIVAGLRYLQGYAIDLGSCSFDEANYAVICTIDYLDPPGGFNLTTFHVVVLAQIPGTFPNTFSVKSDVRDPKQRDNSATEETLVLP